MEIPTPIEQGPIQTQRVPTGESSGPSGSQPSEIFGAHLTRLLNGKPLGNGACSSSPIRENKEGTTQGNNDGDGYETPPLLLSQALLSMEEITASVALHMLIPGGRSQEGQADLVVTAKRGGNEEKNQLQIKCGVTPGTLSTMSLGGQSEPADAGKKAAADVLTALQDESSCNGHASDAVSMTGQLAGTANPDAPATAGLVENAPKSVSHLEKGASELLVDAATPKVSDIASKAADSTGAKDRERVSQTPEPITIMKKNVAPAPEGNKEPQMSEGNAVISGAKKTPELSDGDGSPRKTAAPALTIEAAPPGESGADTYSASKLPDQISIEKAVFSGPQPVTAEMDETRERGKSKDEHPREVSASGETASLHEGVNHGMSTRTVHQKAEVAQVHTFKESFFITKKDGNSIEVSLRPEGMGKLQIHLSLDGETIHARVGASEAAGRDFIDKNIQNILNALSDEGINIGSFSVHLRDKRDDSTGGEGDVKRYRISEEEPVAAAVSSGDTLVNIFV